MPDPIVPGPGPIAPGWKTSEFWLNAIAPVFTFLAGFGLIAPGSVPGLTTETTAAVNASLTAVGLICSVVMHISYAVQRTKLKSEVVSK